MEQLRIYTDMKMLSLVKLKCIRMGLISRFSVDGRVAIKS